MHKYPVTTRIRLINSPFGFYDGTKSLYGTIMELTYDGIVPTYLVKFDDGAVERYLYSDEFVIMKYCETCKTETLHFQNIECVICGNKMKINKAKHTPSPWWVEVHDKVTTIESKYFTITNDIGNDNANLVAAAPDLLNVCIRALRELKDGETTIGLEEDLETAIAKAEGKLK